MAKFLDHVAAHRLGGCFALTLLGLRREEVGGLRWSDIDLEQARCGSVRPESTSTDATPSCRPRPTAAPAICRCRRASWRCSRPCARSTCASAWPWGGRWPTATCCCRGPTAHGCRCASTRREFAAQRKAAGLKAITLGKLRHSNISRMRAAGIAADVVAAWHGHTERMTQAVYGRVTDDRLTAASAVFSRTRVGQS